MRTPRFALTVGAAFAIVALVNTHQPAAPVPPALPVLVSCSDSPTCATTPTNLNGHTVTALCEVHEENSGRGCVLWNGHSPAPTPIDPGPGASL